MMEAAIYARVSSDRQKEDHTISSQTAALKEYATSLGLSVSEKWVFEDDGVSGATLVRPALERLRDLISQLQVPVVLCYAPDRLARKYAYQVLLLEEFSRHGTEIRFLRGAQGGTPEDELLLQFQGMIAEYERAQIAERSRRGKVHRARAGSISVLSGAPYGYRYIRKTADSEARYEILESEAAVVREIYRRYVEEQVSMHSIAKWLTESGIATASGTGQWNSTKVRGVLRNPAYCGRAAFARTMHIETPARVTRRARLRGSTVAKQAARRERPRDQWIEIAVPAIISPEVFELASRRREDNKRFSARHTKRLSLLQGLISCHRCDYAYTRTATRSRNGEKIYLYYCARQPQGGACRHRYLHLDDLDELVWNHVITLLSDPTLVTQELDRRVREFRSSNPGTAQKSRLEMELGRLTAAIDRLLSAYQEDLLSLDELRRRLPELRKKESGLRADLQALEARLLDQETYLQLAENLESFLGRLASSAVHSSIQERQRVVRLLIREVRVDDERVVIRHSIPTGLPGGTADAPGYLLRVDRLVGAQ